MASLNPVLRLRRAFRSMGTSQPLSELDADELADEAADAVSDYGYSRRESDLRHQQMMADMRHHITLTILIATGLILTAIIGAVSIAVAILD